MAKKVPTSGPPQTIRVMVIRVCKQTRLVIDTYEMRLQWPQVRKHKDGSFTVGTRLQGRWFQDEDED